LNCNQLSTLIAELDILLSFAQTAATSSSPYVRPTMLANGNVLQIQNGRHPCIEKVDGFNFIPNDLDLKRGESHLAIITGPNAGGKYHNLHHIYIYFLCCVFFFILDCFSNWDIIFADKFVHHISFHPTWISFSDLNTN
jgi:hypothetical protein